MAPGRIDLRHAVVAVTGAARGIGLATAELFLQEGARVCLADIDGEVVADVARTMSPRAHPFQVDVAAEGTVGPIDVRESTPLSARSSPSTRRTSCAEATKAAKEGQQRRCDAHRPLPRRVHDDHRDGVRRRRTGERHAAGAPGDDRSWPRSHRQRRVAAGPDRAAGAGQLHRLQARRGRPDRRRPGRAAGYRRDSDHRSAGDCQHRAELGHRDPAGPACARLDYQERIARQWDGPHR